MGWDLALFDRVRKKLIQAEMEFATNKVLGGVEPDLIVKAPNGRLLILELKTRTDLSRSELERAVRQAERIQRAANADGALVVIPKSTLSSLPSGVVQVNDLVKALTELQAGRVRKTTAPSLEKVTRTVFAAMPFDEKYDDVFYFAITHAAKAIGAKAYRVDKDDFAGDILTKLLAKIKSSIAVVADISEAKANVLYEVGYAHALNRPCVHLCSTPVTKLPFDVAHWSTIAYKAGQVHALRETLTKRLKALLK